MIQYRYKLSDCKANEKHNERCIQGIVLKKDEWFVSTIKILKLNNFAHLIIEDLYDPIRAIHDKNFKIRQEAELKAKEIKNDELKEKEEESIKQDDKDTNNLIDEIKDLKKKDLVKKILDDKLSDLTKSKLNKLKVEELQKIILD